LERFKYSNKQADIKSVTTKKNVNLHVCFLEINADKTHFINIESVTNLN
jgi:hypothetical protein